MRLSVNNLQYILFALMSRINIGGGGIPYVFRNQTKTIVVFLGEMENKCGLGYDDQGTHI